MPRRGGTGGPRGGPRLGDGDRVRLPRPGERGVRGLRGAIRRVALRMPAENKMAATANAHDNKSQKQPLLLLVLILSLLAP